MLIHRTNQQAEPAQAIKRGIVLLARSGSGKTVACRKAFFDCLWPARYLQGGEWLEVQLPYIPCWVSVTNTSVIRATQADRCHRTPRPRDVSSGRTLGRPPAVGHRAGETVISTSVRRWPSGLPASPTVTRRRYRSAP